MTRGKCTMIVTADGGNKPKSPFVIFSTNRRIMLPSLTSVGFHQEGFYPLPLGFHRTLSGRSELTPKKYLYALSVQEVHWRIGGHQVYLCEWIPSHDKWKVIAESGSHSDLSSLYVTGKRTSTNARNCATHSSTQINKQRQQQFNTIGDC